MRTVANSIWELLKTTLREFSQDDCPQMAAALAYYTVFSLPPLLVLLIVLAGLQFGEAAVQGRIEQEITRVVGPDAASQIQTMIASAGRSVGGEGGTWATLAGGIALLFGATSAFAQLQTALNRAWGLRPRPQRSGLMTYAMKRALSFGMILLTGFLLLVSLVLSAMLSYLGSELDELMPWLPLNLSSVFDFMLSLIVISALFAAIYRILPDARITWKDVGIGAIVTGVLFVVGKTLIGVYLGHSDPGSAFGTAGSLVLVLLWIYFSSMILLLGAEFTQVWARRSGAEIQPTQGAVRVKRQFISLDEIQETDE